MNPKIRECLARLDKNGFLNIRTTYDYTDIQLIMGDMFEDLKPYWDLVKGQLGVITSPANVVFRGVSNRIAEGCRE